jgi:transketolase
MTHHDFATALRFLSVDMVEKAKSGHPGLPLGMADVVTVLYREFLQFDPKQPSWPNRDRFVLSAGHGSALLYALNHLLGYAPLTIAELKNFRQLHSKTPGHPELDLAAGIEMTTGPLGQGLATAVGMALAERHLNAKFGDALINHHTYVLASDGDLMEGITHEACSLAGHWGLEKLIVLYDSNQISIDGSTNLSFTENVAERFHAYGWHVQTCNGHQPDEISRSIQKARIATKPSIIICQTTIGYGAPNKQGGHNVHGSPLGADEMAAARQNLNWPHAPFDVPADILSAWRAVGQKGASAYQNWADTLASHSQRMAFLAQTTPTLPQNVADALAQVKSTTQLAQPNQATRQASGVVLDAIVPIFEQLMGGSADLTPSNNTFVKGMADLQADNYAGRYVRYGVREHGMAAIMNGMALHGGIVPYSGTFLSFSDYCRPSLRLAALMRQRVIHVMTHDSIGLGEDGPTHQPVEHFAALRAIPHLQFLRPADGVETAEAWELALQYHGPTVLALSRQSLPTLRINDADNKNKSAQGAYLLRQGGANSQFTLVATGSEVSLAVAVHEALKAKNIATCVVSMPCRELFLAQDQATQKSILGSSRVVVIEAGIQMGWESIMAQGSQHGLFFGVNDFGLSAPFEQAYDHFGLTVEKIVTRLLS